MAVPTHFRAWKQRFTYQGKVVTTLYDSVTETYKLSLFQILLLKFYYYSPMETQSSSLNPLRIQVPYPFETRKKLTPSPIINTAKNENLTANFINDANSRLLNSRQLSVDSAASNSAISKSEDSVNISKAYSSGIDSTSPLTGLTLKFH